MVEASMAAPSGPDIPIRVVDSVSETGPKLVEAEEEDILRFAALDSPVRFEPIVFYDLPDPQTNIQSLVPLSAAPAAIPVTIRCEDAATGASLPNVDIRAFTNFAGRIGDQGVTDGNGKVTLSLAGGNIERLYAFPGSGHWNSLYYNRSTVPGPTVSIQAVDLASIDSVRRFYGSSTFNSGTGVKVGILDTGIGPHANLNITGGRNTVTGEPANDFGDWQGHGTHVAGLVGSNGTPPSGLRGVAPGVDLRAYRVFGHGVAGASNYAIMKALIFAAADGCDIVNLSLGGGPHNHIVEEAIRDAVDQGMLVLVAAGNDGRKPVSYPAAYPDAVAVSAMGVVTDLPPDVLDRNSAQRPPFSTADPNEFIADFSNVGPEIGVTGPGVGVLSTLPSSSHGPMSGTSMATPVVAGCTAALLSVDTTIFHMTRDRTRGTALRNLLQRTTAARGFGGVYEGFGLPDPARV